MLRDHYPNAVLLQWADMTDLIIAAVEPAVGIRKAAMWLVR